MGLSYESFGRIVRRERRALMPRDAIELLTRRNQGSLSEDREAKHAYPQRVTGP